MTAGIEPALCSSGDFQDFPVPSPEKGAASDMAAYDAAPVPLLIPICAWPLGCDEIATERDVCSKHADVVRDLWADFDNGEMANGH